MPNQSPNKQLRLSSSRNLAPFIDYCDELEIDWVAIANECSMPSDVIRNSEWLLSQSLLRFVAVLERDVSPHIGVEVGQRFTLDSLPELEQMINESQDISEALNKLAVFMNSMNNHVIIWTEYFEGQWWFCHRHGHKPTIPGSTQAEWYRTCQFITFCRVFFGKRWKPRKLKMMGKYNPSITKKYFANTEIEFDYNFGAVAIEMPKEGRHVKGEITSGDINKGLVQLIQSYAILPWFTIDWFANILCTTPRTLQRQLRTQSLSFKQLKEQTRKDHAMKLLTETDLSTSDIAWESGYSDLSNFNRAFKAWTGTTPSAFRRKATANQSLDS
ncbi:helix-turn-helix domain-containing protein [Vibrio astriarenae]|uniref:Helix-turn-helix domain-containing protein n=1 Tax=Vibrio astriarenae TaxID=1481923 RepID=A0A7Z2YFR0_9VIBR|nr:helix-turn-helix domain-containing protein [Vibrio astriarenae]QIA65671.1 helix-turn-helix domain-containing protein [Vibrio astriarenae]